MALLAATHTASDFDKQANCDTEVGKEADPYIALQGGIC